MTEFITIRETAERLHISERTLRKYIKRGEFGSYAIGGRRLLRWSEIETWIESRRQVMERDSEAREMLEKLLGKPA